MHDAKPGLLSRGFEKGYELMATGYRVTLDASLRVPWLMLIVTLGTIVATVWAFSVVKKGFLPTEDTSIIIVRTEAAPDIAFQAMLDRQRIVSERIRADPDVLYVNSNVQQTSFNATLNRGSIFVQLKGRNERLNRGTISDVQNRLRRNLAGIPGIRTFPVPLQNLRIGSRGGAAAYQYTLTSVSQTELYDNAQRLIDRVKAAPGFADVTSDLTLGARQLRLDIDRDALARFGLTMEGVRSTLYSAFGTRKIATVYTPSNDYAVILEADRLQTLDPSALSKINIRNSTGQQVRLELGGDRHAAAGAGLRGAAEPAARGDHHVQPGVRVHAGRGRDRHARARTRSEDARHHHGPVRRYGAGVRELVPRSADPDPGCHPHDLHRARHSLREFHPPDHDSVRLAVGQSRRAC